MGEVEYASFKELPAVVSWTNGLTETVQMKSVCHSDSMAKSDRLPSEWVIDFPRNMH